jgi:GH25 family lysozyme M1 (1,4-beta-N-acetylmuramidase)
VFTLIDLSDNNGPVDWRRLKHAGIAAAYLKASEGVTWNDETYAQRRRNAHAAGLYVGAYHFARPHHNNAKAEAEHFCRTIGQLGPRDLLPALDLEEAPPSSALFQWAVTFNATVHEHVGRFPIFYSYPAYIEGMKLPRPVGSGLWLASYGRDDGKDHGAVTPAPWKRWVLHQFTSKATVGGAPGLVDLSHAPSLHPLFALPAV